MTLDKFLGTGFKALDWNSIPASTIQLKTKSQNDSQVNYFQRKSTRSISEVVYQFQDKDEANMRNDMGLRQDTQNSEQNQQDIDKEIENYYLEEDFEIHETEEEHNSESNRNSQVDLHIKRQTKTNVDYVKQQQEINSEQKEEESVELGVTEGSTEWGDDKQARIQMKLREKYSKKTRRKTEILQYLPNLTQQQNSQQQGQASSLKRLQQGGRQCINKNSNNQIAFNNEDKSREDFKGNLTKIPTNVPKQYLKSDSGHILNVNKIENNNASMMIKQTATTAAITQRARTRSLIANISNRPEQVEQLQQKQLVLGSNRVNSSCFNQANSTKSSNSNHRSLAYKGGDVSSNISEYDDMKCQQIIKENSSILIRNNSKDLQIELQDQKGCGGQLFNNINPRNEDIDNEQIKSTKQHKNYAIRRINQSSSPTQKKMNDRSNQDKKKYKVFEGIEADESCENCCQLSKDKNHRIYERRKGNEIVATTSTTTTTRINLVQEKQEGIENRHNNSNHRSWSSQQVVLGGRVSGKQGQVVDLEKNNKQKEYFSKSFRTSFYNDHKRQNSNLHLQDSTGVLTEGSQYQQEQQVSRVVPQMSYQQYPLGSRNRRTLNEFYKYKPNQLNENPSLAQLSSNYLQFTQMAVKKDELVSKYAGYFNFKDQELTH